MEKPLAVRVGMKPWGANAIKRTASSAAGYNSENAREYLLINSAALKSFLILPGVIRKSHFYQPLGSQCCLPKNGQSNALTEARLHPHWHQHIKRSAFVIFAD